MEDFEDAVMIDRDDVSNYNPEQILPEPAKTIENIRKWLNPTEYDIPSGEYRKHLSSHAAGTGSWLTSNDTYQEWLHSKEHGLLWIRGIAGSGKSVVSAHLIDELTRSNPGIPVLYFFFRQIIDANHEPVALLRDWQAQVLNYSPPLQKHLNEEYVLKGKGVSSLSAEDHWKNLRLAFNGLRGQVYCVADALDEMNSGNENFLEALGQLGRWNPEKVKILITSRPVPSVEMPLRKTAALHLRLEEKMVNLDIASYVRGCLETSSIAEDDWERIMSAVPGRADGLFLYAKLAMDAFLEPGASVEDVMRRLPDDLNDMYSKLLDEHARRSGVPPEVQLLILQWITHATRPLRLLEVADMINVTFLPKEKKDLKHAKELVRAAAGPLLEILPDESLCVVHHSFTEFLKGSTRSEDADGFPVLHHAATHESLAQACLIYLQSGCLDFIETQDYKESNDDRELEDEGHKGSDTEDSEDDEPSQGPSSDTDEQRAKLSHAFLSYASANWFVHARRSISPGEAQSRLITHIDNFLSHDQHRKRWLKVHWGNYYTSSLTPLQIASKLGLSPYAQHLLNTGTVNVNKRDLSGKTALWHAAKHGYTDIVRLLIGNNANLERHDRRRGMMPLHIAAIENHHEVVRALLEAGVDPVATRKGPSYDPEPESTALMYACRKGHMETVEVMLPFLNDTKYLNQALYWSAQFAEPKLVERLARCPGVDINVRIDGDTPLLRACATRDRETILSLIEAGADAKVSGEESGYTPLHALFDRDEADYMYSNYWLGADDSRCLTKLLVEKGVDIQQRASDGSTALHVAVREGNMVAVRILLEHGADVNAVDGDGRAPIHSTSHMHRTPGLLALLINHGADINKAASIDLKTPLLQILSGGQSENIPLLLEHKPDLSARDKDGKGALFHAVSRCSYDTVKLLLEAGVDPNEADKDGNTCLHSNHARLVSTHFTNVIDLLLQHGADINAQNTSGETPLFNIGIDRHQVVNPDEFQEEMKRLLARGADIHARDFRGRTLLHDQISKTSLMPMFATAEDNKLKILIELGVDPLASDFRGNTLLHELAYRVDVHDLNRVDQSIALWKHLTDLGISPDQGNNLGRTPLHILCSAVHSPHIPTRGVLSPLFDLVLSTCKNINAKDRIGISPLHLAVTVSEHISRSLLEAGADCTNATLDGLTPLHLAARARQCNVVGMILARLDNIGKATINATDSKGRTPLYYACRSGMPESVGLLLENGARVTEDLFDACAEFEEEQELWERPKHTADEESNRDAGGLTCTDLSRPAILWTYKSKTKPAGPTPNHIHANYVSPGLEEIIDLLVDGADASTLDAAASTLDAAISTAAECGRYYTLSCLLYARDCLVPETSTPAPTAIRLARRTVDAMREVQLQVALELAKSPSPSGNLSPVDDLLFSLTRKRQFHAVEGLVRAGVDPALGFLALRGYSKLLDRLGSCLMDRGSQIGKPHVFPPVTHVPGDSLLLSALRRSHPNMAVVRLLVEKWQVDVNDAGPPLENQGFFGSWGIKNGPLHFVAQSSQWWHVVLALPYLLKQGADIEGKNSGGQTPLQAALEGSPMYIETQVAPSPFQNNAVRVLVEAGADVNAVDAKGKSCLALASSSLELTRLLISHGARIGPGDIIAAIENCSAEILDVFLASGVDANLVLPCTLNGRRNCSSVLAPLILHAARQHGVFTNRNRYDRHQPPRRGVEPEKTKKAIQMVEVLLSHGADPLATFKYDLTGRTLDSVALYPAEKGSWLEEMPVLHHLILQHEVVHPILLNRQLDWNHRDGHGRTVFHLVGQHTSGIESPIDTLALGENENSALPTFLAAGLDGGADPIALDNYGRNILHHLIIAGKHFITNRSEQCRASNGPAIAKLGKWHPALLDQQDCDGKTPLLLALEYFAESSDRGPVQALLDAGCDITLVDNEGNNALHVLAYGLVVCADIRSMFQDLAQRGLDINARNAEGETPIFGVFKAHKVQEYPRVERIRGPDYGIPMRPEHVLDMLQKLGADIKVRDNIGRTLLHHAAQTPKWNFGELEYFRPLKDAGLDPMDEDSLHRTAVDIATACGNRDVLQLFEKDCRERKNNE